TTLGKVLHLVDKTATQTPAITLLQGHHIELSQQTGDPVQVGNSFVMGQKVLPAAGKIMTVGGGGNPHLDVKAQQPHMSARLELISPVEPSILAHITGLSGGRQ